jgi:hypothetical protein
MSTELGEAKGITGQTLLFSSACRFPINATVWFSQKNKTLASFFSLASRYSSDMRDLFNGLIMRWPTSAFSFIFSLSSRSFTTLTMFGQLKKRMEHE